MKKLHKLFPWPLVIAGIAVLALSRLPLLNRFNSLLLTGLLLIVAGIVGYVWRQR